MIHSINAENGEAIWVASGQASNNQGMLTGTPVIYEDVIIVPVSGSGVITGGNPKFECCENHGAVTALNVRTGEKLWEYHTMPAAQYTGAVSSTGVKQRGPSGAPIWTTPTIDSERGQIYVTTGENTSHPTTGTSDSIIALDLETGEEKWVFQALENDMWNFGCSADGPNCIVLADTNSVDFDFGGPAILVENGDKQLLIAGQKSGDIWALDPDSGALVWNQRVGEGTALGGNHWGIATDSERAFMTINDPGNRSENSVPGIYTYFVGTGEPSWSYKVEPDCDARSERLRRCESLYGFSATPLSVDGAVITGGLDGRVFIFNSDTGEQLFKFDTVTDFETVNGVEGYGGSIDSHSISAGSGMVFVGSGYGSFSQVAGNVLLAFKPSK
jgi:polyvinyl alcohol dehydrogenase (cytochrome)